MHSILSLPSAHLSSWLDDILPNFLWATIVAGCLDRSDSLRIFREISNSAKAAIGPNDDAQLGHNFLSTITFDQFRDIFSPIVFDQKAQAACSALALVESLPDFSHWQRLFSEPGNYSTLASGVARCLDHQSQESTDIRWMKVYFMVICGRVHANPEFIQNIVQYPDFGDMRVVRPSIRAFEMAMRSAQTEAERPERIPHPKPDAFWLEMMTKTTCLVKQRKPIQPESVDVTSESVHSVLSQLCDHFMRSIGQTSVDPRLDGAFGLAISMLSLALEVANSPSNNLASGRLVLRTIVENYITLRYLSHKDDEAIWLQFRNYGSGQTVLAFLKQVFEDGPPEFIDMQRLEMLANEDAWLETRDISLGNWAKLDLRRMATESNTKDVYDAYYDWSSGFVHGHWGAIRDSSFTVCGNPLHRLHRIPSPINPMPPVLVDCCKICNRGLDEIAKLFPPFNPRIDWRTDNSKS